MMRRLGQLAFAHGPAGDRRGAEHLRLDHLGLAVADRIDRADPAVPDVAQDRRHGGRARVDVGVDPHRRDQPDQRRVVDQRDDQLRAFGLGADAGEDVGLVVVGQRQHRVHRGDVRLLEQVEVEPVAVQHHGALERVGRDLGAGAAALDDLQPVAAPLAFQLLRHVQADVAGADDQDALDLEVGLAEDLHHPRQVLGGGDHVDLVVAVELVAGLGHEQPLAAAHPDHHGRQRREQLGELAQRRVQHRAGPVEADADQLRLVVEEALDVERGRRGQPLHHRVGDRILRRDHHVDRQVVGR